MRISDYSFLALASLRERRGRTAGAIVGVTIAVIALSMALGIGQSFQSAFERQIQRTLVANSIFVSSSTGITEADLAFFRSIEGVRDVYGIALRNVRLMGQQGFRTATLVAVDPKWLPQFLGVARLEEVIEEGSPTISGLGVALGSDLWRDENTGEKTREVGEALAVEIIGRGSRELTIFVVGLIKETGGFRGPSSPDTSIFMDPEAFFTFVDRMRVYNLAVVIVEGADLSEQVASELRTLLPPDARVITPAAVISQVKTLITSLQTILAVISSVGMGVTALWVFDSMTISVVQRTKEIGILKAIGYRSRDILVLFLLEAMFVSVIGSAIGIAISLIASLFVGVPVFGIVLRADLTPTILALSIVLPIASNLVASLFPARRAARLDPVRALRYE